MGSGRPQSRLAGCLRPQPSAPSAHEPLPLLGRHRHGGAAAQPQHHREQPREREHPRLQAQQDRVPGSALPEAHAHPAPIPAAATSSRPASKSATAPASRRPPRCSRRASSTPRAKNSTSRSRATVSSRCSAPTARSVTPATARSSSTPRGRSSRSTACRCSAASSRFRPAPLRGDFAEDGQVTVQTATGNQSFRLSLARFANPAGLRSLGGNLYEETAASGTPEVGQPGEQGFGSTLQGYIEILQRQHRRRDGEPDRRPARLRD
jgi:hypothetical protein